MNLTRIDPDSKKHTNNTSYKINWGKNNFLVKNYRVEFSIRKPNNYYISYNKHINYIFKQTIVYTFTEHKLNKWFEIIIKLNCCYPNIKTNIFKLLDYILLKLRNIGLLFKI